jgi:hypothetical protein
MKSIIYKIAIGQNRTVIRGRNIIAGRSFRFSHLMEVGWADMKGTEQSYKAFLKELREEGYKVQLVNCP